MSEPYDQLVGRYEKSLEENARLVALLEQYESPPPLQYRRVQGQENPLLKATPGAAGWDLRTRGWVNLYPGERVLLGTGIAVAIPDGWVGQIWPRSGNAVEMGIDTLAGVIDADFRGEVRVLLINHATVPVRFGDDARIAQLLVVPCLSQAEEVEELPPTARQTQGFGSTGDD